VPSTIAVPSIESPTKLPQPTQATLSSPAEPPTSLEMGLPLTIIQPTDGSTLGSSVIVKGNTRAGATVSINNKLITSDGQGNFSLPLILESGPAAIDVIATDSAGNQAETLLLVNVVSTPNSATQIPEPPAPIPVPSSGILPLKLTQPVDGATISSANIAVKGQTGPGATVTVNDEVITADDQGNFNVSVSLQPGPNAIDVMAIDSDGNSNEVLIIVNAAG
jgi:hypothetical protein